MKNNKLRCTAPRSEDAELRAMQAEIERTNTRLHEVATLCATVEQERDAALARLAELEKQEPWKYYWEPDGTFNIGQEPCLSTNTGPCNGWKITPVYAAAGASPVEPSLARVVEPVARIESKDALCLANELEAIRQAHWTHWAAEENHVVAVSVRHLRLLANHNDAATPQAAAQQSPLLQFCTCEDCKPMECEGCRINRERRELLPAPGEAAREYMTGYSDGKEWAGATSQAQPSQALELSDDEIDALLPTITLKGLDPKQQVWLTQKKDAIAFARAIIAAINAKGA